MVAEAALVVIALVLIAWYVITNYQNIVAAFWTWFEQLKEMVG